MSRVLRSNVTTALELSTGEPLSWAVTRRRDGRVQVEFGDDPAGPTVVLVLATREQVLEVVNLFGEIAEAAAEWAECEGCGQADCAVAVSPDGERARHPDC